MFSRNLKFNRLHDEANAPALLPPPQAPAVAPCLISADIVVNGDISTVKEIQIDGTMTGNLRAARVTIGQAATIRGDVVAEEVTVRGHVIGTITGRRVQLSGTAHVEGDIRHESMGMDMGARLDGRCCHAADPLAQAAPHSPVVAPKPVSLARAALRSEDRGLVTGVAPKVELTPPDARGTASASESSAGSTAKLPLSQAVGAAPTASPSADTAKSPETDLTTLKSTGLEMRAKASKSGRKASAAKTGGRKSEGPDSASPAEEKIDSASPSPQPAAAQPMDAGRQGEASAAPEPVQREAAAG